MRKVNARPNFQNLCMETLKDEDLEEWLQRPGPTPPGNAGALEAHVRVLVCHQTENEIDMPSDQTKNEIRKPKCTVSQKCYHVARSSFDAIEEHLRLPVQTLPTMSSMWGVQSSEFVTDTNAAGRETMCLDITMSNASIPELAHYGLAMSYDFSTRRTTAFVKGINAVDKDSGRKYQPWQLDARIRNGLHDTMPLWPHPLLLPVILLQHELAAIREFSKEKLHADSHGIQDTMRLDYNAQARILGGLNSDEEGRGDRAEFTNWLNGLLCSAHSTRRALRVNRQAAGFLLGILDELKDPSLCSEEEEIPPQVGRQIRDTIMTLDRGAAGFEAGIDCIIATLETQVNIV
ncbi:hypothetical protein INS49_004784 [Diaporthe citri]|uniref:uncharacterized protein n=1 Tax=Diaporthe citri TaxID=83186 RepID=UPI001C803B35|nr:uncharacterized protein INS49_004784 [Diaporthe citri]KAG6354180.1 hypothetical protein INS49_004784 [Diaporthe citri]